MKRSLALLLSLCSLSSVLAGESTWNRDADGSWLVATNWIPTNAPNAVGDYAWLTNNIGANRTLTIDAGVVIGHITIGDSNDSNNFIVNSTTNGSLAFATTNAQATLDKRGTKTEVINASLYLQNDLRISNAGPVTINGTLSESGGVRNIVKEGPGLLTVSNLNTVSGGLLIGGGVYHATITNALPFGNLAITNGIVEIDIQDLARNGGAASNQMQITGGQSGFGANGAGNRTARFGAGASSITWGSTFFNPDVFVLNATNAGRQITVDNAIDLNGQTRRIDVNANLGVIGRNITNGVSLVKGGNGTLQIGGVNRWSGPTIVTGGALRVDSIGALPTNNVELHNGVLEFSRNLPDLHRGLGSGSGEILLNGNSGWGAVNAERIFLVGSNSATLVWGSGGLANLAALALNGSNTSGMVSIANPIDLNGAMRTVSVQSGVGRLLGGVTNSSASPASLVKNGGGTLLIDGPMNFPLSMSAGNLQLGDYWDASGTLPGTSGDASSFAMSGSTLVLANPGAITATTVLSGVISGTGNLTKNDRRTLQLTSTNTYIGNTTVDRGLLLLDFGAAGAPPSNLVAAGSALILGNTGFESGTVLVRAASQATNRQTFRGVTVNASAGRIVADGGVDGSVVVALSNLTRNAGGTLDFATTGDGSILTSTTNTFGILGGYATFKDSNWAAQGSTSGLVVAYTAYTEVVSAPIADASNTNVRAAGALTIAAPTTTIQTLTITNDGSAVSVDLGGKNLRLAVFGGILVPPGGGALTIGSTANDGLLNSGFGTNTGGALIFINNSTNETLVNAAINNNGVGTVGLVKAGPGPLRLAGNVRAYGTVYANAGATRMSGVNVITNLNLNGGDLWLDAASSNTFGGTITINAGTLTVDGPLASSGALDVGTVGGGRGVLRISNDLAVTRLRGGANDNARSVSAIYQTGGQVFSTAEGNGTTISDGLGSYGYYRISGGSITGNITGTFRGQTVFDVEGGRVTPSNNVTLVNQSGQTVLNLRGGQLYAPFNGGSAFRFNATDFGGGFSVLNVIDGMFDSATTTNNKALDLAAVQGNGAWLHLAGGVVTANQIKASTTNAFSGLAFDGGTLAAAHGTSLGSTFLQGISTALVYSGGAIIDVNTNSITIGQSLRGATDHGLAAIAVNSNCGSGYFAPPLVFITGGSGTGAQAIAELDLNSGSITNFRVVNRGTGYQASDVLTVSLSGGTPTTPSFDFTVSGAALATNLGGGLYKTGGGTLTLTNANTYAGLTTVRTGVLAITHSSALGTVGSGTTVSNFARLNISGNLTIAEPLWLAGEGDVLNAYNGALRANTGTNTVTGPITLTIPGNTRIRSVGGSRLDVLGGITSGGSNFPLVLNAESSAVLRVAAGPIVLATNSIVYLHGGGGRNLWAVNGNVFGTMNLQYNSVLVLETNDVINTNALLMFGVDSGNGTNAVLDLNGFNQTIAQFRGGTVADAKRVTNGGTNQSVLAVGNNNASASYNGRMEDGTASLALRKIGSGTMNLQGDLAFTGFTAVEGGILALQTNAALASSSILVSAGAKLQVTGRTDGSLLLLPGQVLGGEGTVEGAVLSLGEVSPGFSNGLLNVTGSYTQTAAGTLTVDIRESGVSDVLVVTDGAGLDGSLAVRAGDHVPASGDSYMLVVASTIAGTFASASLPAVAPGLGWQIDYQPSAVVLSVTGTPGSVGYDLWAGAITNGLTNYNDSATGDGYPNLLKYATGSSPTNADNLAHLSAIRTGGAFALQFNRNTSATDVTLVVEGAYAAQDGANWNGIATNVGGSWGVATNVNEIAGTPAAVTVQDTVTGATNRFLRLRITRP